MLTSLAYIFLLGLLLGILANKLRLPSLIGMIITGIILGPYAFNLLDESIGTSYYSNKSRVIFKYKRFKEGR